jgi:hypothetical protein
MNYLVSLDTFPFQEMYEYATLTQGTYQLAAPSNFAVAKSMVVWSPNGSERVLEKLDSTQFDALYPNPSDTSNTSNIQQMPTAYCIKVAESQIWFNYVADQTYQVRLLFYAIPSDATDTTVSQLVELAKLALIRWAASDGFRMMRQFDSADAEEAQGNNYLAALKRRYQLAQEEGARFISTKESFTRSPHPYLWSRWKWWY